MKNIILISLLLFVLLSSCHVGRYVIYNYADVNDYKKFPQVKVMNDPATVFYFKHGTLTTDIEQFSLPEGVSETSKTIADYHRETQTTAFLIVRNDSILYENYFGKTEFEILTSFSVSKSFIGALVGIAIDEGAIGSVNDPMTKYLHYWDDKPEYSKITIAHLLDMKSGIIYNENYKNPFGDVAKYYYGRRLEHYLKKMKIGEEPGKKFKYVSINTLLLSLIIEQATGMPTEKYFEEKLWKPLGMEFPASWNKDRRGGTIKAFCCLNARLRDYAKFGRLYLNWGEWEGRQIISREWIAHVRNARPEAGKRIGYARQWWVGNYGDFAAIGYLGQYIYVYPDKNLIIVRTGSKSEDWLSVLQKLALSDKL